jgi:putative SOS response-associated peptidase YedK
MCGRYSLAGPDPGRLRERFALGDSVPVERRFNIAPAQDVLAVTTDREGRARGELLRWGLVPHWADSPKAGHRMINARAESLDERPAFRDAFARFRCLVIADGFYEWQPREHGPKQPWWITREDHEPFAFAGLWSIWRPAAGVEPLRSCAIVTTQASSSVRALHDRMPVILGRDAESAWLDPGASPASLRDLLVPFERTAQVPVGRAVGDAAHDEPDCIVPIELERDEPAAPPLF